jgi:large subunit ribosomal protein L3
VGKKMVKSIIGTKVGMTQIFDAVGNIIPVTMISAGPCVVTAIRTKEKNGYTAVQLGFGAIKDKAVNKPSAGNFKKNNIAPKKMLQEFRVGDISSYTLGQEIKADVFKPGDFIDATAVTKGKGFAGTVKRHGFRGGPSTHGQSDRQRAPGGIGAQGFQRVLPGLRMAGHMGDEYVTIQRLEVVSVDSEKNIILVRGCVPGVNRCIVVLNKTVKKVSAPSAAAIASGKKAEKKKPVAPSKDKKK